MSNLVVAAMSALWFGILTSVSPCPLATNITAISFVGRRTGSPSGVLLTGLLYTLGRSLVYVAISMLLVSSLLSAPTVSLTLQTWMNKLLGPILILAGMVMLGLIRVRTRGGGEQPGETVGPLEYGALTSLAVDRVPNGAGHVAIVEVLSSADADVVIYYGRSAPFDVEPGRTVDVPVAVRFSRPPAPGGTDDPALVIVGTGFVER